MLQKLHKFKNKHHSKLTDSIILLHKQCPSSRRPTMSSDGRSSNFLYRAQTYCHAISTSLDLQRKPSNGVWFMSGADVLRVWYSSPENSFHMGHANFGINGTPV
jgi:hypothetical protein